MNPRNSALGQSCSSRRSERALEEVRDEAGGSDLRTLHRVRLRSPQPAGPTRSILPARSSEHLVGDRSATDLVPPSIASDGVGYLIVWHDDTSSGEQVLGALVSSEGAVLPPGAFAITSTPGSQGNPSVVWGGGRYLVVWTDRKTPPGQWVVGVGYDDTLVAEKRHPTRQDLDKVSTEHPIYLMHVSYHFGAANSKALEIARITKATPDPAGGKFRRDSAGEPTGVLEELPAYERVTSRILRPLPNSGVN